MWMPKVVFTDNIRICLMPPIFICPVTDCGKAYSLPNGHVEFEGRRTTYDERVPVTCDVEYEVRGNPFITCLSDGSWSTDTTCNIRGNNQFIYYFFFVHVFEK